MFRNAFFDLDGTLVDTIPDIAAALNFALAKMGIGVSYKNEEVKRFINHGTKHLLAMAMGEKRKDESLLQETLSVYLDYYSSHYADKSKAFDGINEVVANLKEKGIRLFVFTNKPEVIAKPLVEALFGQNVFESVLGQDLKSPTKPDPTQMLNLIKDKGIELEAVLFIGDSEVDLSTARNAGVKCAILSHGYSDYSSSWAKEADYLIDIPKKLLKLL